MCGYGYDIKKSATSPFITFTVVHYAHTLHTPRTARGSNLFGTKKAEKEKFQKHGIVFCTRIKYIMALAAGVPFYGNGSNR